MRGALWRDDGGGSDGSDDDGGDGDGSGDEVSDDGSDDGDSGSDDGGDDGADVDEFALLELGGGARAHRARMRALVRPLAQERIDADLARLPSAALWRAVAPTRAWLDAVVMSGGADERSVALPALLCGVWWIAPQVRNSGRAPRTCGACGVACADVDVHFVLGGVDGGAPCSCARAAAARAAFFGRVATVCAEAGIGSPVGPGAPRNRAALARALGGKGDAPTCPPLAVAVALARAFVDTLGSFAARERAARAAAAAPAPP